jgi:hypothetical protein
MGTDLFFRVGRTIVSCGLSPTAAGRRNFMKKRTNHSVVVELPVAFFTLPSPLYRPIAMPPDPPSCYPTLNYPK